MKKFTKKIAKQIAYNEFLYVLDCIVGNTNYDYNLKDDGKLFEDNFIETLLEEGFSVTRYRINLIIFYFDSYRKNTVKMIGKKYKEIYTKHYF